MLMEHWLQPRSQSLSAIEVLRQYTFVTNSLTTPDTNPGPADKCCNTFLQSLLDMPQLLATTMLSALATKCLCIFSNLFLDLRAFIWLKLPKASSTSESSARASCQPNTHRVESYSRCQPIGHPVVRTTRMRQDLRPEECCKDAKMDLHETIHRYHTEWMDKGGLGYWQPPTAWQIFI